MKKKYSALEYEIEMFSISDVITTLGYEPTPNPDPFNDDSDKAIY